MGLIEQSKVTTLALIAAAVTPVAEAKESTLKALSLPAHHSENLIRSATSGPNSANITSTIVDAGVNSSAKPIGIAQSSGDLIRAAVNPGVDLSAKPIGIAQVSGDLIRAAVDPGASSTSFANLILGQALSTAQGSTTTSGTGVKESFLRGTASSVDLGSQITEGGKQALLRGTASSVDLGSQITEGGKQALLRGTAGVGATQATETTNVDGSKESLIRGTAGAAARVQEIFKQLTK